MFLGTVFQSMFLLYRVYRALLFPRKAWSDPVLCHPRRVSPQGLFNITASMALLGCLVSGGFQQVFLGAHLAPPGSCPGSETLCFHGSNTLIIPSDSLQSWGPVSCMEDGIIELFHRCVFMFCKTCLHKDVRKARFAEGFFRFLQDLL